MKAGRALLSVAALVLGLVILGGCQAGLPREVVLGPKEKSYEALFPYYAELCAASQFRKRPGVGVPVEGGGFGGHSVIYLNGVCRAKTERATALRLCEGGADAQGVGISVNAHYKNANWAATAPRAFFFHGTLKPGEPLTRTSYEETLAAAKSMGLLDGVIFHEETFADLPKGMSRRDYMYEISLGTDYALNQARDRYCARVPLKRSQMVAMINYLNEINAAYRDGKFDYHWNLFQNNCSHLFRNAFAAAGITRPWATYQFWPLAVLRFPVPKNEFVNLMRRTNDMPLADLKAIFEDHEARQALLTGKGLPTRPGALAELEAIAIPNEVYDPDIQLVFYDDPLTGRYQRHLNQIVTEPRYTDLEANLRYFLTLYRKIESERKPLALYFKGLGRISAAQRPLFSRFYDRYYAEIAHMRDQTERALSDIAGASEQQLRQ